MPNNGWYKPGRKPRLATLFFPEAVEPDHFTATGGLFRLFTFW
jgi:hypothetical protein